MANQIQNCDPLTCSSCGNNDYFFQIMAYESHIVNGNRDYIRLATAEVDRYECIECGAIVPSFDSVSEQ